MTNLLIVLLLVAGAALLSRYVRHDGFAGPASESRRRITRDRDLASRVH